jgi:sialate O-acetylesterase
MLMKHGHATGSVRAIPGVIVLLAAAVALSPLRAAVSLPAVFGDHMVLQQGATLPVWGTAAPGEQVTVAIDADHASATAGADGTWRVDLQPLPYNATGTTLSVVGTNRILFTDVLVGDVWLASGQSNMERSMGALANRPNVVDINQVIATATNPQIRICLLSRKASYLPQSGVPGGWKPCSPDLVKASSAIAYFFAQALQQKHQHAIGMIDASWGGMPIRTFTSLEACETVPNMQEAVATSHASRSAWLALSDSQRAAALADYRARQAIWFKTVMAPYRAAMARWQAASAAAKATKQPVPPRPVGPASSAPTPPDGAGGEPGTVFNGMIHPLIPYAIKGILWYQGEQDATSTADQYGSELMTMIRDWRGKWKQGDVPFLVVGLANFRARQAMPTDDAWTRVRAGQVEASLELPQVALAQAIDVGEAYDIHPVDKLDVARRCAAAAEHLAYGGTDAWAGPTFAGATFAGTTVTIAFDHADGGLVIRASPWPADNPPEPTDHLVGFAVAGADRTWVWADAVIHGTSVVLSSPQVPAPVAVRFAWANNPHLNLYNQAGFPAVPFRTDDWPLETAAHPTPTAKAR